MDQPTPPKWELPDSEKSFADLMREASGGRKAGIHTGLPSWLQRKGQIENPLLKDLIEFAGEPDGCGAWLFTCSMYVYFLIATAFLGMLLILSTQQVSSLVWLGPWLLALAAISWALEYDYRRYGSSIGDQLRKSGVVEKILLGQRELAQIYDWTPRLWSLLYLGPRPRNFKGWLRLLVRNLDWYVSEPRPLFRVTWVFMTLYTAAMIGFLALAGTSMVTGHFTGNPGSYLAFVSFALLSPVFHAQRKTSVGLGAFREFIRERFAEDLAEAEQSAESRG